MPDRSRDTSRSDPRYSPSGLPNKSRLRRGRKRPVYPSSVAVAIVMRLNGVWRRGFSAAPLGRDRRGLPLFLVLDDRRLVEPVFGPVPGQRYLFEEDRRDQSDHQDGPREEVDVVQGVREGEAYRVDERKGQLAQQRWVEDRVRASAIEQAVDHQRRQDESGHPRVTVAGAAASPATPQHVPRDPPSSAAP